MAAAVVWRNPKPLIRNKQTVQPIQGDQSCAVYVVINPASARVQVDLQRDHHRGLSA